MGDIQIDTSNVLSHVRSVVDEIYAHETPDIFREAGVDVIEGKAKFLSSNEIDVDGKKYYSDKFIIATGSSPLIPNIKGIEDVEYLTNETMFLQDKIPESMIIIG